MPFPPEFLHYLPAQHNRIRNRPWWFLEESEQQVTRIDRATIDLRVPGECTGRIPTSRTVEQVIADYDARHPRPHPGLRVGQVWASKEEVVAIQKTILIGKNLFYSTQVDSRLREDRFKEKYKILLFDPAGCAPWMEKS